MRQLAGLVSLLLAAALIPSASYAPVQPITALAPVEIPAAAFGSLWGVAVDSAGNVYVADREAGTVTRIAPDQTRVRVAAGLRGPIGLAFDLDGRLLIAEERAGRVVRVEADGRRTPVMSDMKHPRWLAVSGTGRLFVAAHRLTHDADPKPDDESAEPEVILTLGPDGRTVLFAGGFTQLEGLATDEGVVYAATRGRREDPRADGVVFQIPILADGSAGPPTRLGPSDTFKRPIGLARDRLGALYVTAEDLDLPEDRAKRAVGKLHHDGTATLFASNLDDPTGLAFDTDGNLYVADGRSGRVVRFMALPAPGLTELPAFTNQATLNVRGTSEPSARVDVFLNDDTTSVVGAADAMGAFAVSATLAPNAGNLLEIFATGHAGDGLTSAPAEARITHDGIPPSLDFQAPPAGAFVRQAVHVEAQAGDGGSGLGSLVLGVGTQVLGGVVAPSLPAPAAAATATWNTATSADGTQTLVATAFDRAGNSATSSRTVIVDNTPPDSQITGGPTGTTQDTTVMFTFAGRDNLTPAASLAFAWRLDDGPWSAFGSATSATIAGLAQGPHVFAVKARDLAGNEDPTPAQRSFTITALRVTITEPTDGATAPVGYLVVRGTVDAAGAEVGVTVNGVPAALQGTAFAVQMPVVSGPTTVTALATSETGATAGHSVNVLVTPGAGPSLRATPESGAAPLGVSFSLLGVAGATVALDLDGDGATDFTGPTLDGQSFTYTQPGIYVVGVTVTDPQSAQVVARTVVNVFDGASLDALLHAKWQALKDALRVGDIPRALSTIVARSRPRYEALFRLLAPRLATIDTILTDLVLDEIDGREAFYAMVRTDGGVAKSFEVRFSIDEDGIWRLKMF
ncbi:MAG: hypothetical protein HYU25_09270 [Candidatus Rokubacteria bacterium]|nr:hypothetical protein [Candidatus Rokubacteria bacterium]